MRTQYALVYKDGKLVYTYDQADAAHHIVADTLTELIDAFAEWTDMDTDDALATLQPGGENENIKIVREEVEVFDLTADELAEITRQEETAE